jgi:hypothetical protein
MYSTTIVGLPGICLRKDATTVLMRKSAVPPASVAATTVAERSPSAIRPIAKSFPPIPALKAIIPIFATQRPDAKSLPTAISANAVLRFCLKVMGQVENDMVLGTSAYKNGVRATMFTRSDRGIGYLAGEGDDPQIVRSFYLDAPAAEAVVARARRLRDHAADILLGMRFQLDLYVNERPARLFDTTPDAVTHEVNSTSFGLFSPVLYPPSCVRTQQQHRPRRPSAPSGPESVAAATPPRTAGWSHFAVRSRHRQCSAGRREDVSAVRRRGRIRHLPVRELGHARAAAQGAGQGDAGHPRGGRARRPAGADSFRAPESARK